MHLSIIFFVGGAHGVESKMLCSRIDRKDAETSRGVPRSKYLGWTDMASPQRGRGAEPPYLSPCKNSSDLYQFQQRPLAKVGWTCPPQSTPWKQVATKIAKLYCDGLHLAHSSNFNTVTFVLVCHRLFRRGSFVPHSPAAPGGNCLSSPPVSYATADTFFAKNIIAITTVLNHERTTYSLTVSHMPARPTL